MKTRLLALLMFFSMGAFAQTTPWSSSPTVTPQTRTLSGSKQIRWIWGTNNIFSLPDTLANFLQSSGSLGTNNYGAFYNNTTGKYYYSTFFGFDGNQFILGKPLFYNSSIVGSGGFLVKSAGGQVKIDTNHYLKKFVADTLYGGITVGSGDLSFGTYIGSRIFLQSNSTDPGYSIYKGGPSGLYFGEASSTKLYFEGYNISRTSDNANVLFDKDTTIIRGIVGSSGGPIPTNGIQIIHGVKDSIGLGNVNPFSQDVELNTGTHNFDVISSDGTTTTVFGFKPKTIAQQIVNATDSYAYGVNIDPAETGPQGIYLQGVFGSGTSQLAINKTSMSVYDSYHNRYIVDSLHHDTVGAGPLQLAEMGDVRAIAAGNAPAFSGTGYSKFASGVLSYITAIPNADLAHSTITLNGTSTSLGGSFTVSKNNTDTTSTGFATRSLLANYQTQANTAKHDSTILYRRTGWNDFNDFVAQGNYTLNGQNIHIRATQSDVLSLNLLTGLQKSTFYFYYRATNGATNAAGPRFGFLTANNTATSSGVQFWFDESTRKINWYSVASATTTTGTSVLPAYTAGDKMSISFSNVGDYTGMIVVTDITTGQSISMAKQDFFQNPSAPTGSWNTAWLSVFPQNTSVAYDITGITYSTPYLKGGNVYVGASIECGSGATVQYGGYTYQENGVIDAGPGDKTREAIFRLPEIVKLKGETYYVDFGTNPDASFSVWKANAILLNNALLQVTPNVYFITPPPNNTVDKTAYRDTLNAMFPGRVIDIFTRMKASTGTGYAAWVVSVDGVHPGQPGHNSIDSAIRAFTSWHTARYYPINTDSTLVNRLASTQIVPGYYGGLQSIYYGADGRAQWTGNPITQTVNGLSYATGVNGLMGVLSQVTVNPANGKITTTSTVQATTFEGTTSLALTSAGTNSIQFFTNALGTAIGAAYNSGGWNFKVGTQSDPGVNNYTFDGNVYPFTDNTRTSGLSANRWSNVFSSAFNNVTITKPATSATLTIANGKTLTYNNSITITGTDATTMTFPTTSASIARTDAANTFTGHNTNEGVTATGATGTGNIVYSISPGLTGSPTAPTQTVNDNSTKIATTAYVQAAGAIHGNSTTTGAATTAVTVTIGSTMANTTYYVGIAPQDLLTAVNWYISAKTTTTFTVTFVSALTGSINFDYVINP